jgi:hypothetical protein
MPLPEVKGSSHGHESLSSHAERASMVELSEQQKQAYWRYNVWLTIVLLISWFVTADVVSGLAAGWRPTGWRSSSSS